MCWRLNRRPDSMDNMTGSSSVEISRNTSNPLFVPIAVTLGFFILVIESSSEELLITSQGVIVEAVKDVVLTSGPVRTLQQALL